HGDRQYGSPWITAWAKPAELDEWLGRKFPPGEMRDASVEELEQWRISAFSPALDLEIRENANPLEDGLTHAIAPGKGCYPGQEVIERIVALGSPARRLGFIEGTLNQATLSAGMKLKNEAEPPMEVGVLTSVLVRDGEFQALALLKKIHAKEGLPVTLESARGKVTKIAPYEI